MADLTDKELQEFYDENKNLKVCLYWFGDREKWIRLKDFIRLVRIAVIKKEDEEYE